MFKIKGGDAYVCMMVLIFKFGFSFFVVLFKITNKVKHSKGLIMLKIKYLFFLMILILLFLCCLKNPINDEKRISGEQILFIRNVKDKYSQICTMKRDGSDLKIISQSEYSYNSGGYVQASWSPDKTKIVAVGGPEMSSDVFPLWLMDMSGNLLQKLSNNGFRPIWKNNNEIIYHKPRGFSIGSNHDIYLINISEQKESCIYQQTDTLVITMSDFHIAGDYGIGYLWKKSFGLEKEPIIAKLKINNWNNYEVLYSNSKYLSVQPRLSQNEEYLIFVKGAYKDNNIFLLELANKNVKNLTNESAQYQSLTWSPDSKKILFTKEEDIFVLDLQTKTIKNITNSGQKSISNKAVDWK